MRVLFDAMQAGNRSGTGRHALELVRALAGLDADLDLTVVTPQDCAIGDLGPRANVLHRPAGNLARLITNQRFMPRLARAGGFDIVHYPANVGALRPATTNVLTIHDLSFLHHPEWFRRDRAVYYRWAVARSARAAARVLTVSEFTGREVQDWLGIPRNRIDVTPNGIGTEFVPASATQCVQVRDKYRLPERYLLYVGTLEPRKNIPRLIEAWTQIAPETEADLVIAGRIGWKRESILGAVDRNWFKGRIHLPGYVELEDLPALLSSAHAFVWPSLFEGFGLPPLEAMACGTPVVTSNTAAIPEIVGAAALLVDPLDVSALADAMRRIGVDAALREDLRAKGLARAAEFTWRACAQRVFAAYQKA